MPAFNCEGFVSESVGSVIDQTFKDWELIIVDDCSSDNTPAVIAEIAKSDSRIRGFSLAENSGSPARPRNRGIEEARGVYIAFLDSDDCWQPRKLDEQVSEMERSKCTISCTAYDVISESGEYIGGFDVPAKTWFSRLLTHNTLGCLTVMYDARKLGKRYFPECGHEDYALWLDLTREGVEVTGINRRLAQYRLRDGSVSSNKLKTLSFFWHIYKHRLCFGTIKSAWLCFLYAYNARRKYSNR
jgi:teichuronic acid biosynthesis glycosyltransferase TuaG